MIVYYKYYDIIMIFAGCKNNDIVRKKLFLLSISLFMRIYKYLKLLLFCVGITLYYIAFYDRNNYKTTIQN